MTDCPTPSKKKHPSCNAAARHVRKLQDLDGAIDVRPYRCRCGSWHVGHDQRHLRRRIRKALRKGAA
jgi:hypothetical protein